MVGLFLPVLSAGLLTPLARVNRVRTVVAMVVKDDALDYSDDLYAIIGCSPDSSPAELRAAFRKSARRMHPDVNGAPDATLKFRKLVAAYDILTDTSKSYAYKSTRTTHGDGPRAKRTYAYRPPEPSAPRPWMFELADSKLLRVLLTFGFIGGQYLSWYLFLTSAAHASASVTSIPACGLGPC